MSVTAFILTGDHNDELIWPMADSLKVEILNQWETLATSVRKLILRSFQGSGSKGLTMIKDMITVMDGVFCSL